MAINKYLINIFIIPFFFGVALSATEVAQSIDARNQIKSLREDENSCVYTVYVRTSKTWNAGTDSIISVTLYDVTRHGILIKDLEAWGGVMGQGYDYYERGNLDVFTGRGPCLESPICSMELASDGSGEHHGWYCNYVEVTSTGPHRGCSQELFTVEQWLALDRSPHELTAVRDNCKDDQLRKRDRARVYFGDALKGAF